MFINKIERCFWNTEYDYRRDKNHVYPGSVENPHDFVVFFRAASGWLQSRRVHPGMIVYRSSNIVGVLGDVFGHQAPLTRPLEVIRIACSTSGEETRITNWSPGEQILRPEISGAVRVISCWSAPLRLEAEQATRTESHEAQGPRERRLMTKHMPQYSPSVVWSLFKHFQDVTATLEAPRAGRAKVVFFVTDFHAQTTFITTVIIYALLALRA